MCKECGCGGEPERMESPAPSIEEKHPSGHSRADAVAGRHPHAHAERSGAASLVQVHRSLLDKNDRQAERNRGFFEAKNLLVLNFMSSPGAGKTRLIRETAQRLAGRVRVGVVVGDLATENDASYLRTAGIPVAQITTGTVCHLDAEMVIQAAKRLDLDALDLLIVENVGNLVCPSDYDLGEAMRVVLLSVTEGEDKPLKYPPLFHGADAAVITKIDLAGPAEFNRGEALENLHRISHHARIFEVSAKTGAGMDGWLEFLTGQLARVASSSR